MNEPGQGRPQETSTLVSGVTVLAIAAIISKLLGTLQKIPLQNIGGDEVFGIYNAVYPFYTLILFITTAGFPVAVSRFVSEYTAQGDAGGARHIQRVASIILLMTGVCSFIICFYGAQHIAMLIGNPQTAMAIQSVSLALLFVPPMAVLRGYFQGQQYMVPTGSSQVIEQFVRVITMVVLLLYFTKLGRPPSWIASGAMLGTVTGAIAGLLTMLWFKYREVNTIHTNNTTAKRPFAPYAKRLLKFAIPVCLGAIVVPILSIVDAFTVPRMLQQIGWHPAEAMQQFGIYARGLPLVQLVAIIFSSLAVALVPSLAEAKFRQAHEVIRHRIEISLRFTWLIGWAASCGLALTATPINRMLFTDDTGSTSMAILAFTAVFSVINIVSASVLQGIGKAVVPAVSLLIAALVKIVLNLLWIPIWGIEGAASAAIVSFAVASIINLLTIRRLVAVRLSFTMFISKPIIALAGMFVVIFAWLQGWHWLAAQSDLNITLRSNATMIGLSSVLLGAVTYLLLLFRLGAISPGEMANIPQIGTKIVALLQKFGVFKEERK